MACGVSSCSEPERKRRRCRGVMLRVPKAAADIVLSHVEWILCHARTGCFNVLREAGAWCISAWCISAWVYGTVPVHGVWYSISAWCMVQYQCMAYQCMVYQCMVYQCMVYQCMVNQCMVYQCMVYGTVPVHGVWYSISAWCMVQYQSGSQMLPPPCPPHCGSVGYMWVLTCSA
jgi:hypothetical protein